MGRRSYGPMGPGTGEDASSLSIAEVAAREQASGQAWAWLSQVEGGVNSPVESVLSQMPGDLIPDRRQSGDRREFTYTFADESQVMLTFRSGGFGGQGSILRSFAVRGLDGEWDRPAWVGHPEPRERQADDDDVGRSQDDTVHAADTPDRARDVLSRIRGDLGSPMEDILSQMPDGMIPERRQSGENRMFTYTFGDGSRMILTFRPRETGWGLVLYTVQVED